MKDLGKGIATAGIWIGVGVSAAFAGFWVVFISMFAIAATAVVWDR